MKKVFVLAAMLAVFAGQRVLAQTPEEILSKTNEVLGRADTEGSSMTVTMKIPLLGSFDSKLYSLGDKIRTTISIMGHELISWEEGGTCWSYDPDNNTVTITDTPADSNESDANDSLKMMDDITDGYDVKLAKETDELWFFTCKKRRDNPDKEAPKKMEVSIRKSDYMLNELKTSMKGVTIILNDITVGGFTEDFVTFNPAAFPDAIFVDKRGEQ